MDDSPSLDVVVDGHRVATLQLGISVDFDIQALAVSVRDGRLVAVHSGRCDVTATLSLQDVVVATRREQLQLPLVLRLGSGMPLAPPVDDTVSTPRWQEVRP
jgi:hypothetical protein